jgi:hypothetical protein
MSDRIEGDRVTAAVVGAVEVGPGPVPIENMLREVLATLERSEVPGGGPVYSVPGYGIE